MTQICHLKACWPCLVLAEQLGFLHSPGALFLIIFCVYREMHAPWQIGLELIMQIIFILVEPFLALQLSQNKLDFDWMMVSKTEVSWGENRNYTNTTDDSCLESKLT